MSSSHMYHVLLLGGNRTTCSYPDPWAPLPMAGRECVKPITTGLADEMSELAPFLTSECRDLAVRPFSLFRIALLTFDIARCPVPDLLPITTGLVSSPPIIPTYFRLKVSTSTIVALLCPCRLMKRLS
ncbi:XRE family transcriptional regulator [Sesbania bispinosa]|nr:XRE family transcriptional regulator [Sesbania bispinosa]